MKYILKTWISMRVAGAIFLVAANAIAVSANFSLFQFSTDLSGYTCLRSAASGTCGAATAQYFDAACDGVTIDSAAVANWVAYGVARGTSDAKLNIPSGSVCVLDSSGTNGCILNDCSVHGTPGIQSAIIRGYGATIKNAGIVGGWGFFSDNTHNALIQNALVGDAGVTLVTAADAAIFSVGDWVCVTGLAIQNFGFPGNWHFFEYHKITAITGTTTKVLVFDSVLANPYKTTWPRMGTGSSSTIDLGGPGMVYKMEPSWNTDSQILGLTFDSGTGINPAGRRLVFRDVTIPNGMGPTAGMDHSFITSNVGAVEADKEVASLTFTTVTAAQVQVQSSSVGTFTINGASSFSVSLNGTAQNTNIIGLTTPSIRAGPTCCGHANSLTLNGVTFTTALPEFHQSPISAYSFSGGTLTIAKASGDYAGSVQLWVPGYKYFMGDNDGSNTCTPANTFTVSDIIDAGTNVQILTDIVSIPVTNICNGVRPPSTFGAYQAMTLSVTSSGPGNLLSNPEMIPP